LLLLLLGCSSSKIDTNSPAERLYLEGEEAIKDERFLIAEEKLEAITKKYPYSEYAVRAQLRLADVYFQEERLPEASAQYTVFRDLHPNHEKIDYVYFRIGECAFFQIPDKIGRDTNIAHEALAAYKRLLRDFPNTSYRNQSESRILETRKKLAQKEIYIANWYLGQDRYPSAIKRYLYLLKTYTNIGYDEEAYKGLIKSYYELKEASPDSKRYARDFIKRYPNNEEVALARTIIGGNFN